VELEKNQLTKPKHVMSVMDAKHTIPTQEIVVVVHAMAMELSVIQVTKTVLHVVVKDIRLVIGKLN
jgi:hypothetical protein